MVQWKCKKGCKSDCCTCWGMPSKFVEKHLEKTQVPVLELVTESQNSIRPVTEDGFCFLLNRQTRLCSSYKDRPYICHVFGKKREMMCPYVDINGVVRPSHDVHMVKALQDVGNEYAAAKAADKDPKFFWARR